MTGQKIVLGKVGLDGHDVGVLLVAKHLSAAGFEVVYLGKRNSPADIVRAAVDEDVAAVGLSCLSGGLAHFAIETVQGLAAEGADIPVLAGGIDEPEELRRMMAAGVHHHFGPGADVDDITEAFRAATSGEPPAGTSEVP